MTRYGRVRHRTAMACKGSFALMVLFLLMPVLNAGGVAAADPGPVFSNLQASGNDVEAGSMVFLTVHLTSSADIVGNPLISFLFPDGTPGPAVTFSRVGGTLRDGDWQATLELSEYLPSGTYEINDLRAVDAASNVTVYDPDADAANSTSAIMTNRLRAINVTGSTNGDPLTQTGASAPKTTSVTVTNTAQTPKDIGTVSDVTKLTNSSKVAPRPADCDRIPYPPNGLFFTGLGFDKSSYRGGEQVKVTARIITCATVPYDFAGASIRLQFACDDVYGGDLYTTWVRLADPSGTNYTYEAKLHLPKQPPCNAHYVTIKELRAWDGRGFDNYFYPNKPYWPTYTIPAYSK